MALYVWISDMYLILICWDIRVHWAILPWAVYVAARTGISPIGKQWIRRP